MESLYSTGHEYAFDDIKFAASLLPSYTPVQVWLCVVNKKRMKKHLKIIDSVVKNGKGNC